MNYDILDSIKNDSFLPTHKINYVMENRLRNLWIKDDNKRFNTF